MYQVRRPFRVVTNEHRWALLGRLCCTFAARIRPLSAALRFAPDPLGMGKDTSWRLIPCSLPHPWARRAFARWLSFEGVGQAVRLGLPSVPRPEVSASRIASPGGHLLAGFPSACSALTLLVGKAGPCPGPDRGDLDERGGVACLLPRQR